ncbi:MAG: DNA polymerase IV [Spirochaetales bacterium]|jgi:DNA polymerase IV|nr:DNA polymerase IV [Spirochaetales bacterium]
MDRTILHCDLNGFYASVECLYKPELKDVPMAVCGNVENRHGIILAKNELAKGFGIVTAETVWQAKKKCPELVLVPPHHDRYAKYSKIVQEIYERFTDKVEPFGIDEAWLDVTGSLKLYGDGKEIADQIRETVSSEVGLTVSVGVSFNKVFAKLGSDYKKPDATTVIGRENYKEVLYPLPVSDLLYVGKSVKVKLADIGINTIGQLAESNKNLLINLLGKSGGMIHDYANGLDKSEVQLSNEAREVKSVGRGMTFSHDLIEIQDIKDAVLPLAEDVAIRLRENELKCGGVQVAIRDPQFKTITRQKQLEQPTHLIIEIFEATLQILKEQWDLDKPIRMLTITGIYLVSANEAKQLSIFDVGDNSKRVKLDKLEQTVNEIRHRYGKNSISLGASINKGIVQSEGEE